LRIGPHGPRPRLRYCRVFVTNNVKRFTKLGTSYQSLGERAGALILIIAWCRSPTNVASDPGRMRAASEGANGFGELEALQLYWPVHRLGR
jgi:hypothetical protein